MNAPSTLLVFVSMFAPEPQGGIQAFHLDPRAGTLVPAAATTDCPNSFFLTLSADRTKLYALAAGKFGDAATEEVTAWRIADPDGRLEPIGRTAAGGAVTCFIAPTTPGGPLLLAHYNSATVATVPVGEDGGLAGEPLTVAQACSGSGVVKGRQDGPHPHAIIQAPATVGDGRLVYAADLGCDAIACYRLDPAGGRLRPGDPAIVKTPAGAGPRHLAFHPDGRRLYAINELANTVGVYDVDPASGRLAERQMISTLPPDFTGTSYTADIKLTPDGRFLYGTNRGHDSIAVFAVGGDGRLTPVEITPSRGKGPQNIAITADGALLLCGNMPGDSLAVFRIDPETGRLEPVGEPVPVKSPSSLAIVSP